MPTYLIRGVYNSESTRVVVEGGAAARVEAAREMVAALGGEFQSLHWVAGTAESYLLATLPDDATAHALSLMVNASGGGSASAVRLLDGAEMDAAIGKVVPWRPPHRPA